MTAQDKWAELSKLSKDSARLELAGTGFTTCAEGACVLFERQMLLVLPLVLEALRMANLAHEKEVLLLAHSGCCMESSCLFPPSPKLQEDESFL